MAFATKDFVEIKEIRDTVVLLRGGELRSVIEVTSVNFDLKSADERTGIIQAFQSFLNTVDFPLQIITQSRKLNIEKYLSEVAKIFDQNSNDLIKVQMQEYERFIQGISELANIMTKKFYIVVPYYTEGSAQTAGILAKLRGFFSKSKSGSTVAEAEFERNKAQLEERVEVVSGAINGVGITPRILQKEELTALYYGYYNFGQIMAQDDKKPLPEMLAPSAIKASSNSMQVGGKFAKTIFVSAFPRFLNMGWLSPIINLDQEFDISMFVHPENSAEVLKNLRDQLGKLEAEAMEEQAAGKVRNPELETGMSDIESLRDALQQGTEKFFRVGAYITFYGASEKDLANIEAKLINMLESQLVYVRQATFRMKEGFISTMPINRDLLEVHHSLNTGPLSSMFPFVSSDLTQDKGILCGINLHNNSLVIFDRFSMENANMVIFGKSGGGKSYTVKLEILRSLMFGTQVFVIDPENEYKYLADTVGGTNVKISISSGDHINPFDLPKPRPDETPADVLRSHVVTLAGFFKLMLGSITEQEDSILDEALRQTYASRDITPDSDFANATVPLLTDFQSVLSGMKGAESLSIRMKKYTEGSFSGFLNNPTNVKLDNQLIVFSIRDMEEELRPVAMYLVLNFIWTQVRTELKRRLLMVDEAWLIMQYEAGGNFLHNIAKRCRKYFLGLTTISQDIPDFMKSQWGRPVINNSSLQLLLKQSPASIDLVKDTFHLTDVEKFFLLEAKVGHGLFFAGTNHVAIRVIASYAEDQIITSDPKQLLEIEAAKKELADQEAGK